jgi:cytochrome b pre-mRNA-processing protein 3
MARAAAAPHAASRAFPSSSLLQPATKPAVARPFSSTSRRALLGFGGGIVDSYRVVGATDRLFKLCAAPANYYITQEERKKDMVTRLEDGEEVGHAAEEGNVWHKTFGFQPTFSTWSHVTMLHIYLLNTRIRCFERDEYRRWQQQLIDHFFFECEKKMHVEHALSSSALRQRYLKDILVQWRGLVLAYDEGLVKGDAILASAVWRNLFKGAPDVDPRALAAVVGYMRWATAALEATSDNLFASEAGVIFEQPLSLFWPQFEAPPAAAADAKAKARPSPGGAAPVKAGDAVTKKVPGTTRA